MTTATITRELGAADVAVILGHDPAVLKAMVRAESHGAAVVRGVRVIHHGYAARSAEFNAGTATYRLQY